MLARAASEPVLFWRSPRPATSMSPRARKLLNTLNRARSPGNAFIGNLDALLRDRSLAREVLLREGYFVADSPSLAAAAVRAMRLEHRTR